MSIKLCAVSVLLGTLLFTNTAVVSADNGNKRSQPAVKIAQSYGCVLECRDKGWAEDQCKTYCRWKENE